MMTSNNTSSSSLTEELPFASYWMANLPQTQTQAESQTQTEAQTQTVNDGAVAEAAAKAKAEAQVKELVAEAERNRKTGVTTVTSSHVKAIAANPYVAESDMTVKETKVEARRMSFFARIRARFRRFFRREKN